MTDFVSADQSLSRADPNVRDYVAHIVNEWLYDTDFYAWTKRQADLLRTGDFSQVDVTNLIEEVESLGRRERRELRQRLARLLQHLLMWQYLPEKQCGSWKATIREQRDEIASLLEDSPSLVPMIEGTLPYSYAQGRQWAVDETGILNTPKGIPFELKEVLDTEFLPD